MGRPTLLFTPSALNFVGDGERTNTTRIDLAATGPFGRQRLQWKESLSHRRWVRFEAWDAAVNGAFTQPVWLEKP